MLCNFLYFRIIIITYATLYISMLCKSLLWFCRGAAVDIRAAWGVLNIDTLLGARYTMMQRAAHHYQQNILQLVPIKFSMDLVSNNNNNCTKTLLYTDTSSPARYIRYYFPASNLSGGHNFQISFHPPGKQLILSGLFNYIIFRATMLSKTELSLSLRSPRARAGKTNDQLSNNAGMIYKVESRRCHSYSANSSEFVLKEGRQIDIKPRRPRGYSLLDQKGGTLRERESLYRQRERERGPAPWM